MNKQLCRSYANKFKIDSNKIQQLCRSYSYVSKISCQASLARYTNAAFDSKVKQEPEECATGLREITNDLAGTFFLHCR